MPGKYAMDRMNAMFAPAERAEMDSVLNDADILDGSELVNLISNVIPFGPC